MKIHERSSRTDVITTLTQKISDKINHNEPVLFLVSGGSSANIAVAVCDKLIEQFTKQIKLPLLFTLSLIDERYGEVGHDNSNWTLLESLGLQNQAFMTFPVLSHTNQTQNSLASSIERFNAFLMQAVKKRELGNLSIYGLFGIGKDGHTAGILPDSPAAIDDGIHMAIGYKSALFTRITITPTFFKFIDYGIVWAGGEEKLDALRQFQHLVPPSIQPAQYLKNMQEIELFTDVHL